MGKKDGRQPTPLQREELRQGLARTAQRIADDAHAAGDPQAEADQEIADSLKNDD